MDYDLMRIKKGFFIALLANYVLSSLSSFIWVFPKLANLVNITTFTIYLVAITMLSSVYIISFGLYFFVRRYERFKNVNLHSIHLPIVTIFSMVLTISGIIYLRFNLDFEFLSDFIVSESRLLLIIYLIIARNLFVFISVFILAIKINGLERGKNNSLIKTMFVFSAVNILVILLSSSIFLLPSISESTYNNTVLLRNIMVIFTYINMVLNISFSFYIYFHFFNFKTEQLIGSLDIDKNKKGIHRFNKLKKYSLIAMFIVLLSMAYVSNPNKDLVTRVFGFSTLNRESYINQVYLKHTINGIVNPLLIFSIIILYFLKIYYEEKRYYINLLPLKVGIIILGLWNAFTIVAAYSGINEIIKITTLSTSITKLLPEFVLLICIVYTLFQTKFIESKYFNNCLTQAIGVFSLVLLLRIITSIISIINIRNFDFTRNSEINQFSILFNQNFGLTLFIFIGLLLMFTKPVFPNKSIDELLETK